MTPSPEARPGPDGRRPAERGAALLSVIVAVALLTALAVDVAYDARVALVAAANARDELRAEYLARSAVRMGRLVVHFQQQLDTALAPARQRGGAAAAAIPRVQLWNLVPVGSATLGALFGEPGAGDGAFEAKLEDEDRKVNAQMDGLATSGLQAAQLATFFQMVNDPRWDFLFDREDENGVKVSRADLAIALHDWTDDNPNASALNGLALESGFGDENSLYDRGEDRYRAKNARFDSLAELHLVAGVSDAFMAAFGARLTVYLSKNAKMNVNTLDPLELVRNALVMADPPGQPLLADPSLPERLQKAVSDVTAGGIFAMSPLQFGQILEGFGISVSPIYLQQGNRDDRGAFDDRAEVFRIRARGAAGPVEKRIDAVVTIDQTQLRGQPDPLGRLLAWHEE
jgi:general secretion pathway protein K